MWIVHPQSVTHCQRRLAAKFQFFKWLRKTDKHIRKIVPHTCRDSNRKAPKGYAFAGFTARSSIYPRSPRGSS